MIAAERARHLRVCFKEDASATNEGRDIVRLRSAACRSVATGRRTRIDWAEQVRRLIDVDYKRARRITLVMDNLNTHGPASLYEAFAPAEARRLVEKLEIVHTPKHGSWLNVAEVVVDVEVAMSADAGVWPAMITRAGTAVVVARARAATRRRVE